MSISSKLLIILLLLASISTAYAGGFLMLHVGSSDGNGGSGPAPCTPNGHDDFTNACNSHFIPTLGLG